MECQTCGKSFANSWSRERHFSSVHENQKFTCESCCKTFTLKSNLKRHQKTVCTNHHHQQQQRNQLQQIQQYRQQQHMLYGQLQNPHHHHHNHQHQYELHEQQQHHYQQLQQQLLLQQQQQQQEQRKQPIPTQPKQEEQEIQPLEQQQPPPAPRRKTDQFATNNGLRLRTVTIISNDSDKMVDRLMLFDDWQSTMAYPRSIWNLCKNQIGCDVIFEVGPDLERMGAHTTVLMARSQAFFTEFAAGPPEQEIQLPEFQPEEVSSFLEFLYTGELTVTGVNSIQVLALAEKYQVAELIKRLVAIQLDGMEVDKFCPFVRKNENHMTDLVRFKCFEYVFKQPRAVFLSGTFQLLPYSFLKDLIAHNRLVLDEEVICTSMLLWASKECEMRNMAVNGENQREVLGNTLYDIRFPLLKNDYFTENISEKGLLTDTEEVQILKYFLNPKRQVDTKFKFKTGRRIAPPSPFKYVPTSNVHLDRTLSGSFYGDEDKPIVHTLTSGMQGYIERFNDKGLGWGYRGNKKDAIIISANKDIRIDYIYVYGNCRDNGIIDVSFVVQDDKGNEISSTDIKIQTVVTQPTYEVGVENAEGSYGVHLNANEDYHLILTIRGENGYYGKGGKPVCSDRGVDITFKESKFSSNNTSVAIGQISGIKFTLV